MLAVESGIPLADLKTWTINELETALHYIKERGSRG